MGRGPGRQGRHRPLGRLLRVLLVALVVGVLLLAADRFAGGVAERETVLRLQAALATAQRPSVEIDRFPFLTQLASRSFNSVRVVGDGLGGAVDSPTPVAHVDLRLQQVRTSSSFARITAASAVGRAEFEYAALGPLAGVPVAYAGDGRVELTIQTELFSVPVAAKVTGVPELDVDRQTVTLGQPTINVRGVDIPTRTAEALLGDQLKPVPLTGIPLGLTVTDLVPGERYLDVALTGQDVVISG
jgi:hypothetical protein